MTRRIALLVAATTSAVVVAFIVPLCFLVANLAQDRATTRAREQAQGVSTLVATVGDRDALERTRFKQKEAASMLGITYDQFRQRYRKYGLGKD